MDRRGEVPKLVVEFVGTFTLIFAGVGAIVGTKSGTNNGDLLAMALAHGLAIGLRVAGKLPLAPGAGYIVAELLGGVAAALIHKAVLPADVVAKVSLGTPLPGCVPRRRPTRSTAAPRRPSARPSPQ